MSDIVPRSANLRILLCSCFLLLSGSSAPAVQHWRILALRVEFPRERPDNPTTTGDGTFDLRQFQDPEVQETYRGHYYDTPPHNRQYFCWHLEALANYYQKVSDGKLQINFDLFPHASDSSYQMPRELLSYGNGRTHQEISQKLCELLRDAITTADSVEGDRLDFSSYQSFLVFHAGRGRETGLINDIPSAYLSPEDLETYLGGAIPVDGGTYQIFDGWIMPEAASENGQVGLNGLMAELFGHQLGLPGLSNYRDNLPAVGGWSLMDTGAMNRLPGGLCGFVPCHPMVWSKILLGWTEPVVVTSDTTVEVLATDIPTENGSPPKAVKIPINSHEYFLLENRQRRCIADSMPRVTFSVDDTAGVWLSVDRYDSFIPGSGILIWHVDEAIIAEKRTKGGINNDYFQRGIDLEEAGGFQDIGNYYSRENHINGSEEDPFYVGNQTEFSPVTVPGSQSNLGTDTGIKVVVESPPADTMSVRISFERDLPGWPQRAEASFEKNPPLYGDVDGDGRPEILALTCRGKAYVWDSKGECLQSFSVGTSVFSAPALADIDGDSRLELIVADSTGVVSVWRSAKGKLLSRANLPSAPSSSVLMTDVDQSPGPEAVVGATDGKIYVISPQRGQILWTVSTGEGPALIKIAAAHVDGSPCIFATRSASEGGMLFCISKDTDGEVSIKPLYQFASASGILRRPVVGDIDLDGTPEVVALSSEGEVVAVEPDGCLEPGFPVQVDDTIFCSPVLGDVDGDGYLEIIVSGTDRICALGCGGALAANFPIRLPFRDKVGHILSSPVLADLDGDRQLEILFGSSVDKVYAVNQEGGLLPGFPLTTVGSVLCSPILLSIDGKPGLGVGTDRGFLHLWDLSKVNPELSSPRIIWGMRGATPQNTNSYPDSLLSGTPLGSKMLLPPASVYCYPNPVHSGKATFRFYLGEKANVNIKIFDIMGQQVAELEKPAAQTRAQTDNELEWDTSGLASGLYLCRVEATGDSEKRVVFLKVAICK